MCIPEYDIGKKSCYTDGRNGVVTLQYQSNNIRAISIIFKIIFSFPKMITIVV